MKKAVGICEHCKRPIMNDMPTGATPPVAPTTPAEFNAAFGSVAAQVGQLATSTRANLASKPLPTGVDRSTLSELLNNLCAVPSSNNTASLSAKLYGVQLPTKKTAVPQVVRTLRNKQAFVLFPCGCMFHKSCAEKQAAAKKPSRTRGETEASFVNPIYAPATPGLVNQHYGTVPEIIYARPITNDDDGNSLYQVLPNFPVGAVPTYDTLPGETYATPRSELAESPYDYGFRLITPAERRRLQHPDFATMNNYFVVAPRTARDDARLTAERGTYMQVAPRTVTETEETYLRIVKPDEYIAVAGSGQPIYTSNRRHITITPDHIAISIDAEDVEDGYPTITPAELRGILRSATEKPTGRKLQWRDAAGVGELIDVAPTTYYPDSDEEDAIQPAPPVPPARPPSLLLDDDMPGVPTESTTDPLFQPVIASWHNTCSRYVACAAQHQLTTDFAFDIVPVKTETQASFYQRHKKMIWGAGATVLVVAGAVVAYLLTRGGGTGAVTTVAPTFGGPTGTGSYPTSATTSGLNSTQTPIFTIVPTSMISDGTSATWTTSLASSIASGATSALGSTPTTSQLQTATTVASITNSAYSTAITNALQNSTSTTTTPAPSSTASSSSSLAASLTSTSTTPIPSSAVPLSSSSSSSTTSLSTTTFTVVPTTLMSSITTQRSTPAGHTRPTGPGGRRNIENTAQHVARRLTNGFNTVNDNAQQAPLNNDVLSTLIGKITSALARAECAGIQIHEFYIAHVIEHALRQPLPGYNPHAQYFYSNPFGPRGASTFLITALRDALGVRA